MNMKIHSKPLKHFHIYCFFSLQLQMTDLLFCLGWLCHSVQQNRTHIRNRSIYGVMLHQTLKINGIIYAWESIVRGVKIAAAYSWDRPHAVNNVTAITNDRLHILQEPGLPLRYCQRLNMLHQCNTPNKHLIVCSAAELETNYLSLPVANQCLWKMSQHFLGLKQRGQIGHTAEWKWVQKQMESVRARESWKAEHDAQLLISLIYLDITQL